MKRKHLIDGIMLVIFAFLYVSSFMAWLFFFIGATAFTMALADVEISAIIQLLVFVGTLANSFLLAGPSARRLERLFDSLVEIRKAVAKGKRA